jgi:DNA-binding GntR family transcriptional regulator
MKSVSLEIDRPEPIKYIVYEKVRSAILFGQLKQGKVINERDLADMLSVSRTPVRLALELLLKDGWVVRDGKSVRINHIYYEDFMEMLPIRLENEKLAIRLSYPLLQDNHVKEIKQILRTMGTCAKHIRERNWESDKRNFLEQEKRFHLYFAKVSDNKHLYRLLSEYMDRFLRLGMISLKFENDSMQTHKGLVDMFAHIEKDNLQKAYEILERELYRGVELAQVFLVKKETT